MRPPNATTRSLAPHRPPGLRPCLAVLVLAGLTLVSCGHPAPLVLLPEYQSSGVRSSDDSRVPVVLVPGILGSKLRVRETGKALWGVGVNAVKPWDGGYELAFPIGLGNDGDLGTETWGVIDEVNFFGVRRVAYGLIEELFTDHGYQAGELTAPRPGDTFFAFHYDWRRLNTLAVARLAEQLEALRQVRGEARLRLNLVCQSNGAYICRHFLKYGGASLDDAEAGRAAPPENIVVEKVILVGTANGGSFRTLREADRGRVFVNVIGRRLTPETAFTFRSLYQDLPAFTDEYLLDEDGNAVEADIYDAETWRRFGWSVFSDESRRRLARNGRSDLFGDEAARLAYLRERLGEARRLQAILMRDVENFGDSRYYLVQNVYEPTSRRAVVVREGDGWQTLFTGDPELEERSYVHALASAPGDAHATRESQLWLSPQERAAVVDEFHIWGDHFQIILDPGTRRRLLEMLLDDPARSSGSSIHSEAH